MNFKYLTITLLAFSTTSIFATYNKTICGTTDDRVPSTDPKVARSLEKKNSRGGCTLTMISSTCAISAGHCRNVLKIAEFNTPPSRRGRIQHPNVEDIYKIDQRSFVYKNGGIGNDYAVFKVLPNEITGLRAGDVQGHYNVSFERPEVGDMIRITGFGLDRKDPLRNLAQQTHTGEIAKLTITRSGASMQHVADTMGGNSGSSIIKESTSEIVGIHTHGGCSSRGGANGSTLISGHQILTNAIMACLQSE